MFGKDFLEDQSDGWHVYLLFISFRYAFNCILTIKFMM